MGQSNPSLLFGIDRVRQKIAATRDMQRCVKLSAKASFKMIAYHHGDYAARDHALNVI
jgi:hypothetical protein